MVYQTFCEIKEICLVGFKQIISFKSEQFKVYFKLFYFHSCMSASVFWAENNNKKKKQLHVQSQC